MSKVTIWTPERIAMLRELWSAGFSASQIAARLGGVTRNAVASKASRLGLPKRAPGPQTRRSPWQVGTPRLAPLPPRPLFTPAVDDTARVNFADLAPDQCKWPCGHPGRPGFGFCGDVRAPGLPYCAAHAGRAYATPTPATAPLPTPLRVMEAAQ